MLGWPRRVGVETVSRDVARAIRWWLVPSRRRSQKARVQRAAGTRELFGLSPELRTQQVDDEIAAFLDFAEGAHPRWICEIGTAKGGTMFLLMRALPSATRFIGIDLYVKNRILLKRLRRPGQRLRLIDGDSHDERTLRKVKRILGGERLDVLFIDGDHTYEGALLDFLLYRELVREGGLIAFHDIQPDGSERGLSTGKWVGNVPDLWHRLSPNYPAKEFIASPTQFGYGIGVLEYTSSVPLPADLQKPPERENVHRPRHRPRRRMV